ncbi:hypothetical protein M0R19_08115 [Candidatus Pacearchaeota archaeon]|nr:hypothetical protein [Candidatus Pacearchaeota archaeon]
MHNKGLLTRVKRYLHPQMYCRAMLWEKESEYCRTCGRCMQFEYLLKLLSIGHPSYSRIDLAYGWAYFNLNPCDGPSDNCPNMNTAGCGVCPFMETNTCEQLKVYRDLLSFMKIKEKKI